MKVGDLVKIRKVFWQGGSLAEDNKGTGTIAEVEHWVDLGAPDRNFGVEIHVLWPSGIIESYDDQALEVINEDR
jgi:hypothetical protein